jgi:hypothetical protein
MNMDLLDQEFERMAKLWVDALFRGEITEEALHEFLEKFEKVFEIKDKNARKLYLIECYVECLWKSKLARGV